MMAPGLPDIALHYHIDNPTIVALTLSIYLLAFALGPLVLGPLSEVYGRAWVLHLSNLFFLAFTLGCAFAPNTGSLIAFRFLGASSRRAPAPCSPPHSRSRRWRPRLHRRRLHRRPLRPGRARHRHVHVHPRPVARYAPPPQPQRLARSPSPQALSSAPSQVTTLPAYTPCAR